MKNLRILKPETGENRTVLIPEELSGQALDLAFDTSTARVERIDNDLIFLFDNESEVRVTDFFVTGDNELPNFILEGGIEIASTDVLKQMNGEIDIKTAAGPATASAIGSGAGDYGDNAGDMIAGFGASDRLGFLDGLGQWSRQENALDYTNTPFMGVAAPEIDPAGISMLSLVESQFLGGADSWVPGARVLICNVTGAVGDPVYSLSGSTDATISIGGESFRIGEYSVESNGQVFLTLDPNLSGNTQVHGKSLDYFLNSMASGQEYSLSGFNLVLTNPGGSIVLSGLAPNVTGENDNPDFTVLHQNWSENDDASYNIQIEDVDLGDTHIVSLGAFTADIANFTGVADAKTNISNIDWRDIFTVDNSGEIHFSPGTKLDFLAEGESFTLSFDLTVDDQQGGIVTKSQTITITGTNDAPTATAVSANATEDGDVLEYIFELNTDFSDADISDSDSDSDTHSINLDNFAYDGDAKSPSDLGISW